ncbi:probable serine/threonine-protein kinase roco6 [Mytilus edulis]|uniref:probable serine/threonine-protein kinase roco6 n=1 Tax=Mytilus edulis TaxID=6550 RepID=UPI0039EEAFD3
MIVGKESVGKTCLLRRLLKENIEDVSSTDGVDIVVRRCKINTEDGYWTIDKDITDDRADRIRRALKNKKNVQDKSKVNEINKINLPTEAGNENNTRNTSKPSQLDTNLINKTYAEVPAEQNISILDNASTNVIKDNNVTLEIDNYVREIEVKHNENVTDTDLKDTLSLSMPSNLMSSVFSTTSSSNMPLNHYALCGLWDFAGQKEFYATHQAFLTNNAIYLVVAKMTDDISKQDVKQVFADFQRVGEYVDFWFDTIHSHSHATVEPQVTQQSNAHIQPPVILVFTGKDEYEKVIIHDSY